MKMINSHSAFIFIFIMLGIAGAYGMSRVSGDRVKTSSSVIKNGEVAFATQKIDVGVRSRHSGPVEVEFKLVNHSSRPVSIEKVITSCGCTTSSFTRELIDAGSSGAVKIIVKPNNLGPFSQAAIVYLNTGSTVLEKQIEVMGVLIEPFVVTPAAVTVSAASDYKLSDNGKFTIYNNTDEKFIVTNVAVIGNDVELNGLDNEVLAARQTLVGILKSKAGAPAEYSGEVVVSLKKAIYTESDQPFPPLRVPYNSTSSLRPLLPDRLSAGFVKTGQEVILKVNVSGRREELDSLKLVKVSSSSSPRWAISGNLLRPEGKTTTLELKFSVPTSGVEPGVTEVPCVVEFDQNGKRVEVSVRVMSYLAEMQNK